LLLTATVAGLLRRHKFVNRTQAYGCSDCCLVSCAGVQFWDETVWRPSRGCQHNNRL